MYARAYFNVKMLIFAMSFIATSAGELRNGQPMKRSMQVKVLSSNRQAQLSNSL
jgi:hypothetical protein